MMQQIQIPVSKSILNRFLVLSALSDNEINLPETQLPNDVVVMHRLLFKHSGNTYNVEDAGTVFRFLTAYLSITSGEYVLSGTSTLNARPIKPLVDVLLDLGADIIYLEKEYQAPLKIKGKKIKGGEVTIDGALSSQFISALMLIAPTFDDGLKLRMLNPTSIPYLKLTQSCLHSFGIRVQVEGNWIQVDPGQHFIKDDSALENVEGDWSSAAFWYALCTITKKSFSFQNLKLDSAQGDRSCASLFAKLGVETSESNNGISIRYTAVKSSVAEFNLADSPDLAPALVVACALLQFNAKFYGLETLKNKESNRTAVLQSELLKLGVAFQSHFNYWNLETAGLVSKIDAEVLILEAFNDHRIAMAFAAILTKYHNVVINEFECVVKSYPFFWNEFEEAFHRSPSQSNL